MAHAQWPYGLLGNGPSVEEGAATPEGCSGGKQPLRGDRGLSGVSLRPLTRERPLAPPAGAVLFYALEREVFPRSPSQPDGRRPPPWEPSPGSPLGAVLPLAVRHEGYWRWGRVADPSGWRGSATQSP